MIGELLKDNRHKKYHSYLYADSPHFIASIPYSLHADSYYDLMRNSS